MTALAAFKARRAFQDGWRGFYRNAGMLVSFTVFAAVVVTLLQAFQHGLTTASVNKPSSTGGITVLLIGIALLQAIVGLVVSVALLNGSPQSVRWSA